MNTPRYLIAKFVPDLSRMEPRNVGVIVWTSKGVGARFLAEKPGNPGIVDGRRIPGYVQIADRPVYAQWVKYWVSLANKPSIKPATGGCAISSESEKFLQALKKSGRGSFFLEDGGVLLDQLAPSDSVENLTNFLFGHLVDADPTSQILESPALDEDLGEIAQLVWIASDIISSPNFMPDFKVRHKGGKKEIKFTGAFQNCALHVFEEVELHKTPDVLDRTIFSTMYKWRELSEVQPDTQDYSLICASPERLQDSYVLESVEMLKEVSTVVNLYSERDQFVSKLSALKRLDQQR